MPYSAWLLLPSICSMRARISLPLTNRSTCLFVHCLTKSLPVQKNSVQPAMTKVIEMVFDTLFGCICIACSHPRFRDWDEITLVMRLM